METFMKQYRVYQTRLVTRTEEFTAELWAHDEEEAIVLADMELRYVPDDGYSEPIDYSIEETWAEEVLV
jgi:hypothetical protein